MDPIRHILIPIDFSSCSLAALSLGSRIAAACHARTTLLHVYPYAEPADREAPYFPDLEAALDDETRASIVLELGRLLRAVPTPPPMAETVVREGLASSEIVAFAEGHEVDLIVLGAHGRKGLDRLVIGSVARHVSRHSPCPVLVTGEAAADATPALGNVLCAVDLSDSSHGTLHTAAALAKALGATLTVHHAVQVWHWEDPWPIARGDEREVREALAESAHERLAGLVARHVTPDQKTEPVVTFGWPREEIVRLATARAADLLVLGTHSSTFVGRVLFGSTAEHVLRAMPCPVLLVRPTASAGAHETEPETAASASR